jgi:RNA polymerase sigma factor (sigma-70 family)
MNAGSSHGDRFPTTRRSVVAAARSADPQERQRAFGVLISSYWKPVYKYIRLRWRKSPEDASDATQEFFTRMLENAFLDGYDPARARLRTFLRICVDGVVSNLEKAARRIKRGGEFELLSLDFELAEGELARIEPPAPDTLDDFFEKELARSLFALAVEQLRSECEAGGKRTHFSIFELYDVRGEDDERGVTYTELAERFRIPVTDVTNHLAYARREFRRIVLEKLAEMCATPEEYRLEARSLLGIDPE